MMLHFHGLSSIDDCDLITTIELDDYDEKNEDDDDSDIGRIYSHPSIHPFNIS